VDLSGADVTNKLPLTALAQGGALTTNVLTWNGTAWAPAAAGGTGTVTNVSGTAGQVNVATGTTTPVISLPNVGPVATTTGGSGIASVTTDAQGRLVTAATANYLTGNQTITLTGDATGSGTTSIPVTVPGLAGKQPAGNYITALTGDGTASGPGSATFTLNNVPTGTTIAGTEVETEIPAPSAPVTGKLTE